MRSIFLISALIGRIQRRAEDYVELPKHGHLG